MSQLWPILDFLGRHFERARNFGCQESWVKQWIPNIVILQDMNLNMIGKTRFSGNQFLDFLVLGSSWSWWNDCFQELGNAAKILQRLSEELRTQFGLGIMSPFESRWSNPWGLDHRLSFTNCLILYSFAWVKRVVYQNNSKRSDHREFNNKAPGLSQLLEPIHWWIWMLDSWIQCSKRAYPYVSLSFTARSEKPGTRKWRRCRWL